MGFLSTEVWKLYVVRVWKRKKNPLWELIICLANKGQRTNLGTSFLANIFTTHPVGRASSSGKVWSLLLLLLFFVFSFFTTASFFKGIGLLFSFRIIKETIENHEWSSGQQTVVSTETHNQSEVREYVSVEYSATHETLPSPLPKAQRPSWKKEQKESTSHRLGGLGRSSVFKTWQGSCTHEVTAAVVTHTRSSHLIL